MSVFHSVSSETLKTYRMVIGIVTNFINRIMVSVLEDVDFGELYAKTMRHLLIRYTGDVKLKYAVTDQLSWLHACNKEVDGYDGTYFLRVLEDVVSKIATCPKKSRGYSLVRCLSQRRDSYPELWKKVAEDGLSFVEEDFKDFEEPCGITEARKKLGIEKRDEIWDFWYKNVPKREKWLVVASRHYTLLKAARGLDVPMTFRISRTIPPFTQISPLGDVPVPECLSGNAILDRHTKKGSSSEDGGFSRFALLGSLVSDDTWEFHPTVTRIYTNQRMPERQNGWTFDDIMCRSETSEYLKNSGISEKMLVRMCARAQVTCAESRPDTYLGYMWGYPVFVKGPFPVTADVSVFQKVHDTKNRLGLRSVQPHIVYMIPDRWEVAHVPEEGNQRATWGRPDSQRRVPVGCRNAIIPGMAYPFLVMQSLVPSDIYPIPLRPYSEVKCGSKGERKWSDDVELVNWKTLLEPTPAHALGILGVPDPEKMTEIERVELLLNCTWRYLYGVPDPVRNKMAYDDDF